MAKQNCWEMKDCGRESSGKNVEELGVCPAASDTSCDGLNNGKNGGRICWAVAGTYCGGKKQGTFAQKKLTCVTCEVMKTIQEEESGNLSLLKPGQTFTP